MAKKLVAKQVEVLTTVNVCDSCGKEADVLSVANDGQRELCEACKAAETQEPEVAPEVAPAEQTAPESTPEAEVPAEQPVQEETPEVISEEAPTQSVLEEPTA